MCATASSEVSEGRGSNDATFHCNTDSRCHCTVRGDWAEPWLWLTPPLRLLFGARHGASFLAFQEEPVHIDLTESLRPGVGREQVFSVSFDPLDGSSIIDANFAVGSVQRLTTAGRRRRCGMRNDWWKLPMADSSCIATVQQLHLALLLLLLFVLSDSSIFSVFGGRELLGQRVSDQKACAIAVYGPRTTLIVSGWRSSGLLSRRPANTRGSQSVQHSHAPPNCHPSSFHSAVRRAGRPTGCGVRSDAGR